jgi:hypothetical protein
MLMAVYSFRILKADLLEKRKLWDTTYYELVG